MAGTGATRISGSTWVLFPGERSLTGFRKEAPLLLTDGEVSYENKK